MRGVHGCHSPASGGLRTGGGLPGDGLYGGTGRHSEALCAGGASGLRQRRRGYERRPAGDQHTEGSGTAGQGDRHVALQGP